MSQWFFILSVLLKTFTYVWTQGECIKEQSGGMPVVNGPLGVCVSRHIYKL